MNITSIRKKRRKIIRNTFTAKGYKVWLNESDIRTVARNARNTNLKELIFFNFKEILVMVSYDITQPAFLKIFNQIRDFFEFSGERKK